MDKIDLKTRWDMLYKEWEYRHRVLWISFNLWGVVVVSLIALPFVKGDVFNLGWPILVLPTLGFGVSLFANLHLLSEAKRMDVTFKGFAKYRDLSPWPHDASETRLKHRIQALSFSKIIGNLFIYVMAPTCLSSAIIQSVILYSRFGSPFEFSWLGFIRAALYLIALMLPLAGAALGLRRALQAVDRKVAAQNIAKSDLGPERT